MWPPISGTALDPADTERAARTSPSQTREEGQPHLHDAEDPEQDDDEEDGNDDV